MQALVRPDSVKILLTDEQRARIQATWSGFTPEGYDKILTNKQRLDLQNRQYEVIEAIIAENPAAFKGRPILEARHRMGVEKKGEVTSEDQT